MNARRNTPEISEIYQAVYQVEVTLYLVAACMALWLTSGSLL